MSKFTEYLENSKINKESDKQNFINLMLKNNWELLGSGNPKILEFEKQDSKISVKMYINLKNKTYYYDSHLWENSDSYYDLPSKHIKFKNLKEIKVLKTIKEVENFIDKFHIVG